MKLTAEQLMKARSAKSAEELMELAKADGIEVTEEQATEQFTMLHSEGVLADEELEKVSGGGGKNGRTEMHCGNCHNFSIWSGYYVHQYFNCPKCGAEKAFVGFKYLEEYSQR